MEKTTHSKYLFQKSDLRSDYFQPIVIGYKIKTPENIGSIIRLADNVGCKEVFFIPETEALRKSKIKKTAASSFNSLKWSFCSIEDLNTKIPDDYKWIAIETSSDSVNIFSTQLPKKLVFMVGNEISGIDLKVLELCNKTVHIPLFGKNTSMNVSHALAVAIFEWQRQMLFF
jgi:tRNA G18 (ribose-2'-O)-methylase SpoU